jgi:hypothetical protein
MVAVNAGGSVIVTVVVVKQVGAAASATVTIYVPAHRPVAVAEVCWVGVVFQV